MAEFEEACAKLGVPLIVLLLKKPIYNAGMEQRNRKFQEEFYERPGLLADSVGTMRYELNKAVTKYNTFRPPRALKSLTLCTILTLVFLKRLKSHSI